MPPQTFDNSTWQSNPLLQNDGPEPTFPTPAPEQVVQPPQQPIELEEPVESPTVISTDSMREQLQGAEDTLKRMQAELATQSTTPAETATPTVTPPPVEKSETPSPTQFIDDYQTETNRLLTERKNEFNRFLNRSDNLLKSQTRSIQQTFDVRRQQADKVAQNAKAATNVLGARTGRMRYAPEIQRGVITGQENALIETLATIDAQELAAVAAAEQAAFDRDYGTFLDKIDSLDTIKKERETTMNELQEAMESENKRLEEESERIKNEALVIEQIADGVTDPVAIFQATGGAVPYGDIVAYTSTLPQTTPTELEFIKGDKYQQSGYFNPSTGEFVTLGRAPGGEVTIGGRSIGVVTPALSVDDIDNLNISEAAKSYVRMYMDGTFTRSELTQELARLGTSDAARQITEDVLGVVSQLEQPTPQVAPQIMEANRTKANTAIGFVDDALKILETQMETITVGGASFEVPTEGGFQPAQSALGRLLTQYFPGTEAKNLRVLLQDSLAGKVAFEQLQEMRDNSPTGGALGQVTERELGLLASQLGSLDTLQGTDQLIGTLRAIRDRYQRIRMINSENTTPDEYKLMYPDATDEELEELSQRLGIPRNLEDPNVAINAAAAAAGAFTSTTNTDPNGYTF